MRVEEWMDQGGRRNLRAEGKRRKTERGEEVRRKAVVLQPSVVCSPAAAAAEQKKVRSVHIYPLAPHHRLAVGPVSAPLSVCVCERVFVCECVCVHYMASVDPRHELLWLI